MTTLYNVVSVDGFIARPDDSEDFIPDDLWPHTLAFFKRYDALVMGRKTYDAIQSYGSTLTEPFEQLPLTKVVVTRDRAFKPRQGYIVAHSPQDALALLASKNILVSSGPNLNSQLVHDGHVNQVVWWRVPTSIGEEGIRPLGDLDPETFLTQTDEKPGPLNVHIETFSLKKI